MVRHAAFRPALDAAAVELQAWLVAASPIGQPFLLRFAFEAQTKSTTITGSDTSTGGTSSAEDGAALRPEVPVQLPQLDMGDSPAVMAVDFAVMHQLKHVTRPKFTWEGATISASQPQNRGPTWDQLARKRRVAWVTDGSQLEAVPSTARNAGPDGEPEVLPSESDCGCEGLPQPLPQGSCKLYDALIVNHGPRDSAAMAAEWHVVMPPHSAFLMSDVTRLSPLMPGKLLPPTESLFVVIVSHVSHSCVSRLVPIRRYSKYYCWFMSSVCPS